MDAMDTASLIVDRSKTNQLEETLTIAYDVRTTARFFGELSAPRVLPQGIWMKQASEAV